MGYVARSKSHQKVRNRSGRGDQEGQTLVSTHVVPDNHILKAFENAVSGWFPFHIFRWGFCALRALVFLWSRWVGENTSKCPETPLRLSGCSIGLAQCICCCAGQLTEV